MGPTTTALHLKLLAVALILFSGATGVSIPLLSRRRSHCHLLPFALAKAFAASVILATGFVHMLPGAMDSLSSLSDFPFPGFAAMMAALGTLVVDFVGTRVYEGMDGNEKGKGVEVGTEGGENSTRRMEDAESSSSSSSNTRHMVASQVLELGIVSHSVIIGLSLGVSQNPSTIKPLIAALSFHQFFEGFALGGCISQACFHELKEILMACFFAITTPGGIAIGLATASFYNSESLTAVVVEGILDSISAGILIYMSLVDLIATDFLDHQKTNDMLLQVGSYVALFLGAGFMSLLAIWA